MSSRLSLSVLLTFGLGSCVGSATSSLGGGTDSGSGASNGSGGTGVGTGGSGSGGSTGSGGTGVGTGGWGSGGSTGSGGVVVGTGGSGTGGRGTGGATATGGAAGRGGGGTGTGAGGTGTGGASVGGSSGWLTGYTATMFGNVTAGDCTGVANFSDMTNISGATCTHQGVPTVAYAAGVANGASFYGAPGDLSSIWMGPQCTCPGGTLNAAGACARAPSCPMELDCGRCFEVKCDPTGTGTYSDGATRVGAMYCNPNQSAVIEVIDACPHNHPNNPWWCTTQRQNHIDISCSAMRAIAGNPAMIGNWGWLNVQVRPVDCAGGLGAKTPIAP